MQQMGALAVDCWAVHFRRSTSSWLCCVGRLYNETNSLKINFCAQSILCHFEGKCWYIHLCGMIVLPLFTEIIAMSDTLF